MVCHVYITTNCRSPLLSYSNWTSDEIDRWFAGYDRQYTMLYHSVPDTNPALTMEDMKRAGYYPPPCTSLQSRDTLSDIICYWPFVIILVLFVYVNSIIHIVIFFDFIWYWWSDAYTFNGLLINTRINCSNSIDIVLLVN